MPSKYRANFRKLQVLGVAAKFMSIGSSLVDTRIAGTYLPSLVLLLVTSRVPLLSDFWPNVPWLGFITVFSLLAAIMFHGLSRHVFGVGGPEENPMQRGNTIQGMQVALTGKGPHEEHPPTLCGFIIHISSNPLILGYSGLAFIFLFALSLVVWALSVPISLLVSIQNLSTLGVPAKLLVFAECVWVLQWVLWRFYTPSYLLDEDDFD